MIEVSFFNVILLFLKSLKNRQYFDLLIRIIKILMENQIDYKCK